MYKILRIITPLVLLSACSTTVITDEERTLPEASSVEDLSITSSFTMDTEKSFLAFTGSKGDIISHEGKFEEFTIDIDAEMNDEGNIDLKNIEATIQIKSMVTDNDGLTEHLLSDDFFAAETFPQARFVTRSITPLGENKFEIEADLTIKETTKTIRFPAEITEQFFLFSYDIDRTAFDVGPPPGGVKGIDAIVPIEAKITLL